MGEARVVWMCHPSGYRMCSFIPIGRANAMDLMLGVRHRLFGGRQDRGGIGWASTKILEWLDRYILHPGIIPGPVMDHSVNVDNEFDGITLIHRCFG